MRTKLKIANSHAKSELATLLNDLYHLHFGLINQLANYRTNINLNLFSEIKISAAFDAHQIVKFLDANEIEESEINGYLCAALKETALDEMSVLTASIIRAKKIIDYEQIW